VADGFLSKSYLVRSYAPAFPDYHSDKMLGNRYKWQGCQGELPVTQTGKGVFANANEWQSPMRPRAAPVQ
jgi:hypothetical protein